MGGSSELQGPDLAKGVALAALTEGEPFVGHAHGEAIVVVRQGETVRAVGGHCTHYNGPLVDGIVVGETIRCPWHHACFSLTSGEALGAPALAPIACYDVAIEGGTLRVGAKRAPATPSTPVATPGRVVIVGAGAAGTAAALELRRQGHTGAITLIGQEAPGPVDRPNLSKDYLAGNAPEEWLPLRSKDDLAAIDVALRLAPVVGIDVAQKHVSLDGGETLGYDALLLATGAEPIHATIPGADLPHVLTLRSLDDSRAIIAAAGAGAGKRAVILGGSFIGLEVAAALRARGVAVDVVARDEVPLLRVLGNDVGRFVQSLHETNGVVFHLQDSLVAIDTGRVTLQSGATLPCDFVVVGIGVRPRLGLAQLAGLQIDNGIVVDRTFRTSADAIWAAGDVARYPSPSGARIRVEHWVAAERQGQAAARDMLGRGTPFVDVPFFWSQHYDVAIGYVGHSEGADRIELDGDLAARSATIVYRRSGVIEAVATIGRDRQSLWVEAAMERGASSAEIEAELTRGRSS